MDFIDLQFHPPIIAHRGASAVAPENTLPAFAMAKNLGIQWVEFDVMLAASGEAIVIHDETVDRTTNGTGCVSQFSYKELKKLDAGSWFNSIFNNTSIPTLQEVLKLLKEHQLYPNIEIKPLKAQEALTVESVLSVVKSCQLKTPVLFSSFCINTLKHLRALSKEVLIGFLMDEWREDWKEIADELNAISLNVNYECLNTERAKEIKATERYLLSYTVNDPSHAKTLFSMGVDAVFSDCPKEMTSFFHV